MRNHFIIGVMITLGLTALVSTIFPWFAWTLIISGPLILIGFRDFLQTRHTILRNFPLIGHFRYLLEELRPEIQQYFIESNADGVPFSRETRSIVYQRAKKSLETVPFGTQRDVYEVGYAWVNHSMAPKHLKIDDMRIKIGGPDCKQPYSASIFNISAMSFGALSKNAIMALNKGALKGGFAHNTGEGSISPYHLQGGDLIWQVGTGYFGCRAEDGSFHPEKFKENATRPEVKMIEIKLSQGAKPGHGGILPAKKITAEIAQIRGVPMGQDVLSPPAHSAFSTPIEMMEFIKQLRDLSGGKPVGFKLCVGKRREFLAVCKAMVKTGITPDFISVDGGEGGTGAAPLEFPDQIGCPLTEGLVFVHNSLVGIGVREKVKIIASSKVTNGMHIVGKLALGADACYSARGMMLALGCIQALRCHSNHCPAGVATQHPNLVRGLVPEDKAERVYNFHRQTIRSVTEILGAMGLDSVEQLAPWHLTRRTGPYEIQHYAQIYDYLKPGDLLKDDIPEAYRRAWEGAVPESFHHPNEFYN
jgi:glutamate synthase domain-containing protein 2